MEWTLVICYTIASDFVQKEAVSASLNKALKADLRASHFTVGSDSVIRMNSVYSVSHNLDSNYKNPALEPEAKAKMAALKSELKDTHYILVSVSSLYCAWPPFLDKQIFFSFFLLGNGKWQGIQSIKQDATTRGV